MRNISDVYKLSNGVEIPILGFGTWQTPEGATVEKAVHSALECGYRHIDTAAAYENEAGIGRALKSCGVSREEIFITSKLWNSERGYDTTLTAFERTMKDLQLDYLDLYLIHWPANAKKFPNDWKEINLATWKAFEKLYKEKRIRAIGLSNFLPHHIEAIQKEAEIFPMVDQIEFHPGFMQSQTVEFAKSHGILIEAWSPLGTGKMLSNPVLNEIAKSHGKSTAQICIRWCLQHGTLPLPKSVTPSRIEENTRVFDFELSSEDMQKIDALKNIGDSGFYPDEITF